MLSCVAMARIHRFLLLLLVLLAMGLRFWRLDSIPPGFHFDEAFEGVEAWRIYLQSSYRPVFLTGNFGVPPLNAYANALTFALFEGWGAEAGPYAMRVTAACFGVAGVLALYGLAAEVRRHLPGHFSVFFPLWAGLCLAIMRWHIHFSRMGIEPVLVPLIWALVLWLFLRGFRLAGQTVTGSYSSFAGAGVVLAAGMYAYQGAWVIPFLVILHTVHLWLARPRVDGGSRRLLGGLLVTASVALLLVLPLLLFFVRHPDLLLMRPTQIAIVGATDSAADSTVWHNVAATARMFGPFGAPGDLDPRRNLPGAPALNLWLALPFYLGLVVALRHLHRPLFAVPVLGLAGLLAPGIFTEYAPHFHRILGASAPVALLCAMGCDWVWRRGRAVARTKFTLRVPGGWAGVAPRGAVLLLLAAALATSAHNYFVRWAALPDLFYAFDSGLWQTGQWIAARRSDAPVYVTPRTLEHATLAFALRNRPTFRTTTAPPVVTSFDGRHIFPLTRGSNDVTEHYVVIEHEDFRTHLLLPDLFPEAEIVATIRDDRDAVYANIYARPAGTLPARAPAFARDVPLGDGIALAGYDLLPQEPRPGEVLYLQLHWITTSKPETDWTVFTHVVEPQSGTVRAGQDSPPGQNSLPTTAWRAGWRILDEYQIALPNDLAPGEYLLRTGLYRPQAGGAGSEALPVEGIDLGTFAVTAVR